MDSDSNDDRTIIITLSLVYSYIMRLHGVTIVECVITSCAIILHGLICYISATNGSDYTGLPEVILFSFGHPLNTPLCANVTIIDDDTLENVETFTVALYTDFPEGVFLTRDRSIVEIIDNEEGINH